MVPGGIAKCKVAMPHCNREGIKESCTGDVRVFMFVFAKVTGNDAESSTNKVKNANMPSFNDDIPWLVFHQWNTTTKNVVTRQRRHCGGRF